MQVWVDPDYNSVSERAWEWKYRHKNLSREPTYWNHYWKIREKLWRQQKQVYSPLCDNHLISAKKNKATTQIEPSITPVRVCVCTCQYCLNLIALMVWRDLCVNCIIATPIMIQITRKVESEQFYSFWYVLLNAEGFPRKILNGVQKGSLFFPPISSLYFQMCSIHEKLK